jgi:predicted CXXCH cytochrome family protein
MMLRDRHRRNHSSRAAHDVARAVIGSVLRWAPLIWAVSCVAPALAARDVGPQRECATCHIMWLEDFKRPDVVPLVAYEPKPVTASGRQDVASTERMCFSCHDGFMLDSRMQWRNREHAHPVGVKPSDKVRIPTSAGKVIFPLNDDGRIYCGTCHTAHGVDWDQAQSPVFLRVKNVESSLCLGCHLDRSTGPAEGNHPVFRQLPQRPAALAAAGAKFGRDNDVICQSCHRPHGAPEAKMLVMSNKDSKLCAECHDNKRTVAGTKHDMTIMSSRSRNRLNQTPEESGRCGVCHVPHGGTGPALWARAGAPAGADPAAAACLSCHNAEGLAKRKLPGTHSHPLNVSIADIGITPAKGVWQSRHAQPDGNSVLKPLPLYDKNGLRDIKGTRLGCGSCHDPHRWSPLTEALPPDPGDTEGGPLDSFLRLPQDADDRLCANCHVDKAAVAKSRHDLPAAARARGEKSRVAGTSVCRTCHTVHDARGDYLWARDSGGGKGAVEVLCKDCHRDGGSASSKVVGEHSHPVAQKLKPGMQPELPLFPALGADRAKKDRVDCATCHDPHRWDARELESRASPKPGAAGDARTSFLRLPAAPAGDLCVECHADKRFVRGTDHDLAVTAPKAENALGETATQSGVCGQCHSVHNAVQVQQLWARVLGDGADTGAKQCLSCHANDRPAAAKVPVETRHPPNVTVWGGVVRKRYSPLTDTELPVFDADGRGAERGAITCPTCHNPHQWRAGVAREGPGANTEGDVRTSFLRTRDSANFLCADCHGADSLFRYKYFHGRTSRAKYPLFR